MWCIFVKVSWLPLPCKHALSTYSLPDVTRLHFMLQLCLLIYSSCVCQLYVVVVVVGCAAWLLGSSFPNQGQNPYLLQWKHSLTHWTTREILCIIFRVSSFSLVETGLLFCQLSSMQGWRKASPAWGILSLSRWQEAPCIIYPHSCPTSRKDDRWSL